MLNSDSPKLNCLTILFIIYVKFRWGVLQCLHVHLVPIQTLSAYSLIPYAILCHTPRTRIGCDAAYSRFYFLYGSGLSPVLYLLFRCPLVRRVIDPTGVWALPSIHGNLSNVHVLLFYVHWPWVVPDNLDSFTGKSGAAHEEPHQATHKFFLHIHQHRFLKLTSLLPARCVRDTPQQYVAEYIANTVLL